MACRLRFTARRSSEWFDVRTDAMRIGPCLRQPVRSNQVTARATGGWSRSRVGSSITGSRQPSNALPELNGSMPSTRTPCLRALWRT
jgi:hypothetical protein